MFEDESVYYSYQYDLKNKEKERVDLSQIMMLIPRLQRQHDAEILKLLPESLKPCTSIHLRLIQRSAPTGADPTH